MLQFLVGRGCGYEEAIFVAGSEAADNARASDGAMYEWDQICELGLEDAVEVCASTESNEAVAICEGREDADPVRLLARRSHNKDAV